MGEGARVISIEALREFRSALWKFSEAASQALADAEGELTRTLIWLETEQQSYWTGQIRRRQERLVRAKEALRQKQLYRDSAGRTPSAIEEEKAVRQATKQLAEAEQKLINTRQWSRRMHKELQNYKGGVQRFATVVQMDVPAAVGQLDKLATTLDEYVALAAPTYEPPAGDVATVAGMARPESQPMPPKPQEPDAGADEVADGEKPPDEAEQHERERPDPAGSANT